MSTVIKANGPNHGTDAASFNFDDLGDRARDYLEGIRRQAGEMLLKAQQESDAIRRQAHEQGRAAALAEAERAIDEKIGKQVGTLVPALRAAVDRLHAAEVQWLAHWEKTAIHVAAAIASRVIRREVSRTPDVTLVLVKEALELAAGKADVQVHMHPEDVKALGEQAQRLAGEFSRLGNAEIVADASIEPGGCRVDTRFGTIDQQFNAQLARIEQELS